MVGFLKKEIGDLSQKKKCPNVILIRIKKRFFFFGPNAILLLLRSNFWFVKKKKCNQCNHQNIFHDIVISFSLFFY